MTGNDAIDSLAVTRAIARLDEVLALRIHQSELDPALRDAHRKLLRVFLETGRPPTGRDWAGGIGAVEAVAALSEHKLVVTDSHGEVTGAYPFTVEPREHRVTTRFGEVRAMCAIDALAVSPMYDLPATVHSKCRVSGVPLTIRQEGDAFEVVAPDDTVFAAIDWAAGVNGATCAATLCTEMMFIVGEANCERWRQADPGNRQVLSMQEAVLFATAIFRPLVE